MLSIISGLVVTGAGASSLLYFRPRNGRVHPLAAAPFLESLIPITIVCAFALGATLIVSGAMSL